MERLRALKLSHLRVDLHLGDVACVKELQRRGRRMLMPWVCRWKVALFH